MNFYFVFGLCFDCRLKKGMKKRSIHKGEAVLEQKQLQVKLNTDTILHLYTLKQRIKAKCLTKRGKKMMTKEFCATSADQAIGRKSLWFH